MKPLFCLSLLVLGGAIAGRQLVPGFLHGPTAIAAPNAVTKLASFHANAPAPAARVANQDSFKPLPPPRPDQIAPRGDRPKTDPTTGLPTCSELAGAQAYDRPLLFTDQAQLGAKTPVTAACVHPDIKRDATGLNAAGKIVQLYGFQMENRRELLQTAAQLKAQRRLWYSPGMYREELRQIRQLQKAIF